MVYAGPVEASPPLAAVEGDENALGKIQARTMRHMGRQAQIMATFSSIIVHRVEVMSSEGGYVSGFQGFCGLF